MFRRTYIVKPAIQLKYMIYGLLGVILTGACVYLVVTLSLVHSELLSQLSQGELASVQQAMRGSLLWVLGVLLTGAALAGLWLFHKIIGPLYAVEKVLLMVADGDLTVYMPLRRGDELQEMADAVEQMVGGIRRRVLADKETVHACQTELRRLAEAQPAAKAALDGIVARLDGVGQDFRLG